MQSILSAVLQKYVLYDDRQSLIATPNTQARLVRVSKTTRMDGCRQSILLLQLAVTTNNFVQMAGFDGRLSPNVPHSVAVWVPEVIALTTLPAVLFNEIIAAAKEQVCTR